MENNKVNQDSSKNKSFPVGKIFWGLLLILLGALILVDNFGLANVNWADLWRLWPLAIIVAGLSILSFNNLFWRIMSVIIAIMTLLAITWVAIGNYTDVRSSFERDIIIDKNGIHITVKE